MNTLIETTPVTARDTDGPRLEAPDRGIHTGTVYVVFTSIEETLHAVQAAAGFAKTLGLPVTVVHFQVVPYPLPVDCPAGRSPLESEEFRTRVEQLDLDLPLRTYLCRTERDAIPGAFRAHSLIIVSNRRRWGITRSSRWSRKLEAAGHFVVPVDAAERKESSHA
jgi:hypothetical protein